MLSPRDELAYSRVLREYFPSVLFIQDDFRSNISDLPIIPSIAHSETDRIRIIIPSPEQEERMKINQDFNSILVRPICRIHYDRSHWEYFSDPSKKFAFDSPLLGWGSLVASFPRDDEENKKLASKIMRLANKVCGDDVIGYDSMRISSEGGKRCAVGIGTHIETAKPFKHIKYYQDDLWDDDPNGIKPLPESRGFRF